MNPVDFPNAFPKLIVVIITYADATKLPKKGIIAAKPSRNQIPFPHVISVKT